MVYSGNVISIGHLTRFFFRYPDKIKHYYGNF